eukprot:CAMPEP_0178909524 /NCGR_PEP_ID=MMETSP0786-20121207/8571_1 /TAXON_ID=186022 /ORGANISM="Thalassionema frauenfeldii, Strain CCMP 1798" /LENGTH=303 /DNA_ID=CAMNT_0020581637 /DNA_START=119 /DNA_END=1031 /DNA_ORIENTATION=-
MREECNVLSVSSISSKTCTKSRKTQKLYKKRFRHERLIRARGGSSSVEKIDASETLINTTTASNIVDLNHVSNASGFKNRIESELSSAMSSMDGISTEFRTEIGIESRSEAGKEMHADTDNLSEIGTNKQSRVELGTEMQIETEQVARKSISMLIPLLLANFFALLSVMCTALSPAPILIDRFGSQKATSILSSISSLAAAIEICLSPILGAILDSWGRKPVLILCITTIALINGIISTNTDPIAVSIAKFLVTVSLPQFFVASSAISADMLAPSPQQMGAFMGIQMALIQMGLSWEYQLLDD